MAFYRVRLGRDQVYLTQCLQGGYIGVSYGVQEDLTGHLSEEASQFNASYVPIMMRQQPALNTIRAGVRCGVVWVVCKGMQLGDLVFTRGSEDAYHVGEVTGPYWYAPGEELSQRRRVAWRTQTIPAKTMSEQLQAACRTPLAVINLANYVAEIQLLLGLEPAPLDHLVPSQTQTSEIVDPIAFAMEKHLEDFMVRNSDQLELSRDYKILEDQGEIVGQQFQTDTGPIDILAISRDEQRLLVIELKRGRASDVVVGQLLRYIGYVKTKIATPGQLVEGAIIALDDDLRLRLALAAVPQLSFYRYQVTFNLQKVGEKG